MPTTLSILLTRLAPRSHLPIIETKTSGLACRARARTGGFNGAVAARQRKLVWDGQERLEHVCASMEPSLLSDGNPRASFCVFAEARSWRSVNRLQDDESSRIDLVAYRVKRRWQK